MPEVPIETFVANVSWLLLGATIVGIVARRLRVPYAVALVVAGLAVEASHLIEAPQLDPGVVLFAFLPPLLFDASFRMDATELRAVVRPVAWLAVPGVLVTAALVGLAAWSLLGVSLGVGLLFGSIVAATDPVAVIAVLKSQRVPERVAVIPEAESLVNDGMAITLYTALIGYAISGKLDLLDIVRLFGREVIGGLAIGAVLAFVFSRLTATIDDHALEMMLSTVLAYGSYLVANELHASGPLACVAAGFIHGTYGRAVGMSAQTSQRLDDLWEYLGFVANAVVFMLVGFSVKGDRLLDEWGSVAIAIVAVVIARVLVVGATRWVTPPEIRPRPGERLVMIWAGLRGALTVALALALPDDTPHRELLITLAFGVVLFTLVFQGLTLSTVVHRMGLADETM
jgi:CPA1 family monovalent cation:H+ antiporter